MSLALILLLLQDSTAEAEPVLPESLVRKTVKAALAAAERKAAAIAWPASRRALVVTLAATAAFVVAVWLGGLRASSAAKASADVIDLQPIVSHEALQRCEHDKDSSQGK